MTDVDTGNDDSAAALEAGRKLFARQCRFFFGAAAIGGLPPIGQAEIAFAGRSNVGKSSLINAITGHNALARTSRTPGRTQQINFFDLDGRLTVVDLPGYGYARASKTNIAAWTALVNGYLKGRPTLRRVMLLIDARHGLKESDREIMAMLDEAAVVYQVVLTKADKTKPAALEAVIDAITAELARHGAAHPEIAATSAVSGAGIPEIRAALAALVPSPNME
ncbi:MAG: ribosome biogenesis GTP-binding protein YihA/YsxC [Pseudomonadota bacterium]|nr:ribosome biogenesis GTP-binding protein YihA/YsxC [Pseudomonadota bacterium]